MITVIQIFSTLLKKKNSGNHNIDGQSRYFNTEEYISATNSYDNNYSSIIHLDIRSLPKNFDFLRLMLNCLPKLPDVIALTETWLSDTTKHLYFMEGYSVFHLVRTNRDHGGISVFVRNDIHTDVSHEFCYINDDIELYTLKIKINDVEYVIATLYRPHSKHVAVYDFTDILINILSTDAFRCNKTIIL